MALKNISPTTVQALTNQAAASGLAVEVYLQRLLDIPSEVQQAQPDPTANEAVKAFVADLEALPTGRTIYQRPRLLTHEGKFIPLTNCFWPRYHATLVRIGSLW